MIFDSLEKYLIQCKLKILTKNLQETSTKPHSKVIFSFHHKNTSQKEEEILKE